MVFCFDIHSTAQKSPVDAYNGIIPIGLRQQDIL